MLLTAVGPALFVNNVAKMMVEAGLHETVVLRTIFNGEVVYEA